MKKNDVLELNIIDNDYIGQGIAKYEGYVIFVVGAIKEEKVLAKLYEVHEHHAFANIVKIINRSPNRIEPICKDYKLCGGCDLQHVNYSLELLIKQEKIKQTLLKVAGIDIDVDKTVENPNRLHYRNKVMVPFGYQNGSICYGFYEKRSHNIVPSNCSIEPTVTKEINEEIKNFLTKNKISIYDEETGTGLFRETMQRISSEGSIMIVLIVKENNNCFNALVEELVLKFKDIKSIYLNINSKKTNVILSNDYIHLYGDKYLSQNILGLDFSVYPQSFLQVNHTMCEALYTKALDLAELKENMNVIDAYCGIGSITLNIAKKVNHVYGIEVVSEAIKNANMNKEINGITNATFICGKCEDEIKKLVSIKDIDVIFFDPPRKGCEQSFLDTVIDMKIKRIIYISCNISSASRDIAHLSKNNYELKKVIPVDLFSYSSHVESVCLLELKK